MNPFDCNDQESMVRFVEETRKGLIEGYEPKIDAQGKAYLEVSVLYLGNTRNVRVYPEDLQ